MYSSCIFLDKLFFELPCKKHTHTRSRAFAHTHTHTRVCMRTLMHTREQFQTITNGPNKFEEVVHNLLATTV